MLKILSYKTQLPFQILKFLTDMISCTFENSNKTSLRHVVTHAIVEKRGNLLLIKRAAGLLEEGKWALPGGFLDRDETIAEGVLRELKEETGWEGEVISLFKINTNPKRPKEDRQNVAFGFIIKPTKQTGVSDHETEKVEWIPLSNLLPLERYAFDHGETIKLFLDYLKKPFSLPVIY